jgi:hypothetical protein
MPLPGLGSDSDSSPARGSDSRGSRFKHLALSDSDSEGDVTAAIASVTRPPPRASPGGGGGPPPAPGGPPPQNRSAGFAPAASARSASSSSSSSDSSAGRPGIAPTTAPAAAPPHTSREKPPAQAPKPTNSDSDSDSVDFDVQEGDSSHHEDAANVHAQSPESTGAARPHHAHVQQPHHSGTYSDPTVLSPVPAPPAAAGPGRTITLSDSDSEDSPHARPASSSGGERPPPVRTNHHHHSISPAAAGTPAPAAAAATGGAPAAARLAEKSRKSSGYESAVTADRDEFSEEDGLLDTKFAMATVAPTDRHRRPASPSEDDASLTLSNTGPLPVGDSKPEDSFAGPPAAPNVPPAKPNAAPASAWKRMSFSVADGPAASQAGVPKSSCNDDNRTTEHAPVGKAPTMRATATGPPSGQAACGSRRACRRQRREGQRSIRVSVQVRFAAAHRTVRRAKGPACAAPSGSGVRTQASRKSSIETLATCRCQSARPEAQFVDASINPKR